MREIKRGFARHSALVLLLAAGSMPFLPVAQGSRPSPPDVQTPVPPKESEQDLRTLPPATPWKPGDPVREVPDLKRTEKSSTCGPFAPQVRDLDLRRMPVLKPWARHESVRIVRPEGSAAGRYAFHVMDGAFAVHAPSGGPPVGPIAFEALWGDSTACGAGNDQSLTVQHDRSVGRWLLSRWAAPAPHSSFHLCVALSRNSDPITGGWYLYDLLLPMYRAGAELEIGAKDYSLALDLGGTQALFTFDRTRMLEGAPAELTRTLPDRRNPKQ